MNTKEKWDTTVKILDGPRRALYAEIFAEAVLPIKTVFTRKADLPGKLNADVYFLDIDVISDEQRKKLITVLAKRWEIPLDEMEQELDKGVPILADGVIVMTGGIDLRLLM